MTGLLYVFQGNISINEDIRLAKGESVILREELVTVHALETAELVFFVTDENAEYYDGGMFSGNKY